MKEEGKEGLHEVRKDYMKEGFYEGRKGRKGYMKEGFYEGKKGRKDYMKEGRII
jgi:hypothetical protein